MGGRENYAQGHIPGAAYVDLLGELSDRDRQGIYAPMPPAEQFAAVMSRIGVGEGTRVVLYDDFLGMYAARVWWMLRAFGFDDAAVLNGGWQKWTARGPAGLDGAGDLSSRDLRSPAPAGADRQQRRRPGRDPGRGRHHHQCPAGAGIHG